MHKPVEQNVTGYQQPVLAVHEPESVDEVAAIVRSARGRGVKLYPVSTGMNWGYGSRSPIRAGCELVLLHRMNRIRNADKICQTMPVALIEPGVTQADLHTLLVKQGDALTFNVTGSSPATSIMGNALDRGVGYNGPRSADLFGLEVVTGTGEVIRTGFRTLGDESPLAATHSYGVGPSMEGLFFQGGFGIVTSACLRLQVRPECTRVVSIELRAAADLGRFIDTMAALKREGWISSVAHIGNRARAHATLHAGFADYLVRHCGWPPEAARAKVPVMVARMAPHAWTGFGAVSGSHAAVRASLAQIRRRLAPIARTRSFSATSLGRLQRLAHGLRRLPPVLPVAAALHAIAPLHGLARGVPTDMALRALLWVHGVEEGTNPDAVGACGLLYIAPALPMDGQLVARALARLETVANGYDQRLYMTANVETATSMVAVCNLLFDRRSGAETDRAHACADALLEEIHRLGLEVYRARADMMDRITGRNPAHWATLAKLRAALDPDSVIAPGRYGID
jgi:4-cresol dehydrogenase (hydroxylating)